jgi:tetratricopeptide (TPR) repeat protein
MYSRALDNWAVELQKANEWEYAVARLELALKLNPENVAAKANLKYNTNFRAGNPGTLDLSKPIDELFSNYRTWDQAVRDNGPIDDPNIVCGQAYFFLRNRNFRQAAQYFDRLRKLFPTDVLSRLWLANLDLSYKHPDEALEMINEIRTLQNGAAIEVTNAVDLLSIEASAYFEKNETAKAMSVIESQLKRHTNNSQVIVAAVKLYSDNGRLADAYALLDQHIKRSPDDPLLLINKGVLLMGETNYNEAIQLFGQVLSIYTNMPTARLYRAIAYVKTGEIKKAKEDYELILQNNPNLREALFGLHNISFDEKDYATALEYGKRYLSNAIPIAPETKLVWTRVKTLQDEAPEKGNLKDKKAKSSTP